MQRAGASLARASRRLPLSGAPPGSLTNPPPPAPCSARPWHRCTPQHTPAAAAGSAAAGGAATPEPAPGPTSHAAAASSSGRGLAHGQPQQVHGVAAAYVHLPFCKRKCFYCDFPVVAIGRGADAARVSRHMEEYVGLVVREVAATRRIGGAPLQTVYFGGGTPSLVPPHLLARILASLDSKFGIAPGAEVTLEADPGTFGAARLEQYAALGVSRLSVGVQAFQQELLEACGRGHDLGDVHEALAAVRASGIPSWSLDLISGLPQLTMAKWRASLEAAIEARPTHVSVYDLQVEEGTPFATWQRHGLLRLPHDELSIEMYGEASRTLQAAGYEHYEVSNYALPGARSRHNQVYWAGLPYYAFGLGAASYLEGRRYSRPAKMAAYREWVQALGPPLGNGATVPEQAPERASGRVSERGLIEEEQRASGGGDGWFLPGGELPAESEEELLLDSVMLRLRTADGLDLQALEARHGREAARVVRRALRRHSAAGRALPRSRDGSPCDMASAANVRLSDPEGFLLSNDIISDVFAAFGPDSVAVPAAEAAG